MERDKLVRNIWLICFLLIILPVAFAIRLLPLEKVHWWDETIYLQHSEAIFSGKANYNEFDFRPPLLPLIFAFGYLFYHHVYTAAAIAALFGTIVVFFSYIIVKRLYGINAGIICSLTVAFIPFFVRNSHYIMTDMPSLAFLLISFYFLIKGGKYNIFFGGIFLAAAILTRFTALIIAIILMAYIMIANKSNRKRDLIIFFSGTFLSLLPYLVWSQIRLGFFLKPFITANYAVSTGNQGVLYYFTGLADAFTVATLIGIGLLLIAYYKKISGMEKYDKILIAWIAAYLLYITIIPNKEARYLIPIGFPIIAISSKGYSIVEKSKILPLGGIAILIIMCSWNSFGVLFGPAENNYVTEEYKVADYMNNLNTTGVIYTSVNYPVYGFYTNRTVVKLDWRDFYLKFSSNMPETGFLVYSEKHDMPNQAWINAHKEFSKIHQIGNTSIYLYDNNIGTNKT